MTDDLIERVEEFLSPASPEIPSAADARGLVQDLADRLAGLRKLSRDEFHLRLALRNFPIIVAKVDDQLRYTWIFNPHPNFRNYSIIGMRDTELADNAGTRALEGLKKRVLETGKATGATISFPLPDGERIYEVYAEPLNDEGGCLIGVTSAAIDITERELLTRALHESRESMRALAGHLEAARENERKNVAREIHDVLTQELTLLKIDVTRLHRHLTGSLSRDETAELASRASEIESAADSIITSVQKIATGLRPAVLDSLGLVPALEWQANVFQEQYGVCCRVKLPDAEIAVSERTSTAAFRIFQEALLNISRHAGSSLVDVALETEEHWLILSISDNGIGVTEDEAGDPMSIGLAGMRERAALLGGSCDIRGYPGEGTSIVVRLPLEENQ